MLVTGEVQAQLSVSPTKLNLGGVHVGETVVKKVVLRGGKAFRVMGVDGTGRRGGSTRNWGRPLPRCRRFRSSASRRRPATSSRELKIKTDVQDDPITITVEGTAGPASARATAGKAAAFASRPIATYVRSWEGPTCPTSSKE